MGTINYILLAILAVVAISVALFLRKQLFPSWTDLYKAFADGDFALAFFLHRQFRRQVLSGKQRYDRFVQEINTSRLAEYQNPKRPAFEVGQENNRRQRMRKMLENESFIREHFKDEPFGFQNWHQMLLAWNLTPITTSPTMQWECNQVSKAALRQEILIRQESVVGFHIQTDIAFHGGADDSEA